MKNEAIEMIKTPLSLIRAVAFCLPLALVTSCGSGSGSPTPGAPEAPTGSTLTVSPDAVPWDIGSSPCDYSVLQDTYFNIVARDPNGAALAGIGLRVSLALAPGTVIFTPPYTPMFLYDDLDGDGFYTDLITSFPHYTTTGGSGTKLLRVQYDLSCAYAGNLDVFSGPAYGTANISVTLVAP